MVLASLAFRVSSESTTHLQTRQFYVAPAYPMVPGLRKEVGRETTKTTRAVEDRRPLQGQVEIRRKPESDALRQEWSESNVREERICCTTDVVVAIGKRSLDILCNPKVDECIVWVVQVRTVVNLEQ